MPCPSFTRHRLVDSNARSRRPLSPVFSSRKRDGVDFNLAVIPQSVTAPHEEEFDTQYMRQLYEFARTMAARGDPWEKEPPDYGVLAERAPTERTQ